MTDLEMVKLCAQAMGLDASIYKNQEVRTRVFVRQMKHAAEYEYTVYDPLHDDAEAMALVKRFDLRIDREHHGKRYAVKAGLDWDSMVMADDLNRAIVQCVAEAQAASTLHSPRL